MTAAAHPDPSHLVVDQPGANVALDLFVLHQHLGALLDVAFADTGVTPSQYPVYSQLGRGTSTPGQIGTTLGLRPGTLSGYLSAMETRGHVARVRNEHDGRSHMIALTETGKEQLRVCRLRMRRALKALNTRLGSAEQVDAVRLTLGQLDQAILAATTGLQERSRSSET